MISKVSLKNESIETSGITKDPKEAIIEYIWNGFEANAQNIKVTLSRNEIDGISEIIIQDDGHGIEFKNLENTFGTFLASEKNTATYQEKSKKNKGKGRFSFVALAQSAKWVTRYWEDDILKEYTIYIDNASMENFRHETPTLSKECCSGTTVTLAFIETQPKYGIEFYNFENALLEEFSWYLYLNRDFNITYDSNILDYSKHIDMPLSEKKTLLIQSQQFVVNLIVWDGKIKEKFLSYFLDSNGKRCGEQTTNHNRNVAGFSHSIYIQSAFFDNKGRISLPLQQDQVTFDDFSQAATTLKELRESVVAFTSNKLKEFLAKQAEKRIVEMEKDNKSFPTFTNDAIGAIQAEHFRKVTKELYCLEPAIFHKLNITQEKSLLAFLNLLLSSEERENVLGIIEQIVDLSQEQRESFSDMLKKTSLENILTTIKFVEARYTVINGLKSLVYDLAQFTTERDHIQKIVEENYWIFGERYHLVTADLGMQKALSSYKSQLAEQSVGALSENPENARRMDIFMCRSRCFESYEGEQSEENIIVELKAPKVVLSKIVYRQIEDYMDFIIKEPQFNSTFRKWKFITVCTELDKDTKNLRKSVEHYNKPGLAVKKENFEIYALTWDDVFLSFDIRHSFMLDKLKLEKASYAIGVNGTAASKELCNKLTSDLLEHNK